MMPDETDRDPALTRHLVLLDRHAPLPAGFTDRVVRDLTRRGLTRRSSVADPRWLAAATIIFALGIGVGSVVATARVRPAPERPPLVIDRVAAETNVPTPGNSEVWF